MIDMSTWEELILDVVTEIRLDPRNVRLDISEGVPESDIIQDLFANEKAHSLVEAIAEVGLLTHEVPIVLERDGQFVVVEGNRRVAALKAIQNPYLAPSHQARIAKLAKGGYAIDPHTATCFKMVEAGHINVITSTAHWVKFTPSMIKACQIKDTKDEKDALAQTAKILNDHVPSSINSLFSAKILHKNIIKEDDIEKCVLEWIER